MTTPVLGLDELSSGQTSKEIYHNQALRKIEGFSVRVLDKDLATPPGSPADGDAYIVAGSPTGAWVGHATHVALYLGTSWVFLTPPSGIIVGVADEAKAYIFNGSAWVALAGSGDLAAHEAASDPHTGYQKESEKGAASGYASLDSGTKVPTAQLPTMVASGASHAPGIVPDPPASGGSAKFLCEDGTWTVPPDTNSGGSVTSVGLSMPSEFSVANSPVTSSGTLTVTKANQTANQVYAGPTSGGAAAPAFRALVAADVPDLSATYQPLHNLVAQQMVFAPITDVTTGDGAGYIVVPAAIGGKNLTRVHARVITAGTTGTTDIQIANVTQGADMLSTKITIDSGETASDTAATPPVIDTGNDDVATNDLLRIDVDAVSTTKPKGLIITLEFA